jgi:hypothetical protein
MGLGLVDGQLLQIKVMKYNILYWVVVCVSGGDNEFTFLFVRNCYEFYKFKTWTEIFSPEKDKKFQKILSFQHHPPYFQLPKHEYFLKKKIILPIPNNPHPKITHNTPQIIY